MERPSAAEILDSGFDLWSDLPGSDPLDRHPAGEQFACKEIVLFRFSRITDARRLSPGNTDGSTNKKLETFPLLPGL